MFDHIKFKLHRVDATAQFQTTAELLSVIEQAQGRAFTDQHLAGFLTFMGFELRYIRRGKKVIRAWNCVATPLETQATEEQPVLDTEEKAEPELSKEELEKLFSPQVNEVFAAEQRRKLGSLT